MGKDLSPQSRTAWAIVYVANSLPEAEIVAGRLQHEGVPALVEHAAGYHALGIRIGTLGEVRVLVHRQYYEIARSILEEALENPELPDGTADVFLDPETNWDEEED